MLGGLQLGSDASSASALAHLLSHAAFKSLLFLAAGVLAHLAGTTLLSGIHSMGRRAPWTTAAWVVGLLSLAALPPFAGFLSKEGVLTAAEHGALDGDGGAPSWVAATLLIGVGLTSVLTGAYAGRLLAVTVRRPARCQSRYQDPEWEEVWEDGAAATPAAGEDNFNLVFTIDPGCHPEDLAGHRPRPSVSARCSSPRSGPGARRPTARPSGRGGRAGAAPARPGGRGPGAGRRGRPPGGGRARRSDDGSDRRRARARHPRGGGVLRSPVRGCWCRSTSSC